MMAYQRRRGGCAKKASERENALHGVGLRDVFLDLILSIYEGRQSD